MGKNSKVVFRLLGLVRPLSLPMAAAVLIGSLGHLCTIFIPIFGAFLLLDAMGYTSFLSPAALIFAIALFAVCRSVFRYLEQRLNHYIAFRLLAVIRDRVFAALRLLAPAKVEDRGKGELISMVTTDIELIEVFYAHTISPVLIALIVGAVICVFLAGIAPLFAVIAAVAYISVALLLPRIGAARVESLGREYRKAFGEQNSRLFDSLRGVDQTIRYDDGENRLASLARLSEKLSGLQESMNDFMSRGIARKNAAILIFSALLLAASLFLLQGEAVSLPGALIAVVAMLGSFAPFSAVSDLHGGLAQTLAAAGRIFDLIDEEPVAAEIRDGKDVPYNGMRCDGVYFSYGGETVLSDINFSVEKGSIIGVSGESGSGKSTLLKLLMRFWDVGAGRVSMSGSDVREINTACLRRHQSYLTQETHLFSGTLLDNIRIAKPDASEEEVLAACEKAALLPLIESLPDGLMTKAGELGGRLSSGECQRIGLARVFLSDARLILLDEPTSNLDSLNESIILKALYAGREGKTIVILSHRKSTLRIAGQLYAMNSGALSRQAPT
jgi:ATP-binding cassette subfamily C protein